MAELLFHVLLITPISSAVETNGIKANPIRLILFTTRGLRETQSHHHDLDTFMCV